MYRACMYVRSYRVYCWPAARAAVALLLLKSRKMEEKERTALGSEKCPNDVVALLDGKRERDPFLLCRLSGRLFTNKYRKDRLNELR